MNYHFLDAAGTIVALNTVRAEYILALVNAGIIAVGDQRGELSYFEALTWAGIGCKRTGAFDRKMFCKFYADDSQSLRKISLDFLNGKYAFECWRE